MTAGTVPGYYGQPVLKTPIWRWPVPAYFFTGGVAAGTTLLGAGARITGEDALARRCLFVSLGATVASGALLVEDLGRPARFLNMLRVAKVTSPMSVGTWVLSAFGLATAAAALSELTGLGRGPARVAEAVATALAPVLGTYTGVLVADTAVPAWHEALHDLPRLFAAGALASSGGLALLYAPPGRGRTAARRMALAGAVSEIVTSRIMEKRLGDAGAPYHRPGGRARLLSRLAMATTATGAALVGSSGSCRGSSLSGRRGPLVRSRTWRTSSPRLSPATIAGALLLVVGALAERFAVFHAGVESARDPVATIEPQRHRLDRAAVSSAPL